MTFSLCRKTAWLISKFVTSQPGKQTIAMNISPNTSRSKGVQTMKSGQLIQYIMRNIFLAQNVAEKLFLDPFLKSQS